MCTMPVIDMAAAGKNIIRLREAAGLTVRELQDIFGFATPQAIYKWQHGTVMPTIDNLVVAVGNKSRRLPVLVEFAGKEVAGAEFEDGYQNIRFQKGWWKTD